MIDNQIINPVIPPGALEFSLIVFMDSVVVHNYFCT